MANLTEYQWLFTAMGWTLLHSIWQISLIGLIWWILSKSVRKENPSAQYLSGGIAMSLIFLATGLTFTSELIKHYPESEITVSNSAITEKEDVAIAQLEIPKAPDNSARNPILVEAEGGTQISSIETWINTELISYLVFCWSLGVIVLGIRFIIQWLRMRQLSRKGIYPFLEKDLNTFKQLQKRLGIKRTIRFLQSDKILSPLTFGHFKPIVLLPLGMINGFPPAEIEAIILHELTHIRQHDFLINLVQTWIEILFFYHPFVWIISKQLRALREHICDDEVIRLSGDKMTYASTLLNVQKYSFNNKNQLAMKINGNKNSLTNRIHRLFEKQNSSSWNRRNMNAYLLGLILLIALGSYAFSNFKTPTVSISADKMNVLYIGLENPITVAMSGVDPENVKLESESLEFTNQGNGHYKVNAKKYGEAIIKVSAPNYETQFIKFRVKRIPDPVARIKSSSGGKMMAEQFINAKGISVYLENFDYDATCEIISYNLTRVSKGEDVVEVVNRGAAFVEKAQRLISNIKTDDIIYIDHVMCQCPGDESPRPINSMVFRIK